MLEVKDLTVCYDTAMVLDRLSFHVEKGELVSMVGPNGAGKTTTLRAISGLIKFEQDTLKGTTLSKITFEGSVVFDGKEIKGRPAHEIARMGLTLSPERGKPFREMSVLENLKAGASLCKSRGLMKENLERVYELFPRLKERERQIAGTLSGGERTMLAIGRTLMYEFRFILVDEPSTGLAPKLKDDLFRQIRRIYERGITMLLVEQDIGFAFDLADRNYVLSRGRTVAEGKAKDLLQDETIRKVYLGL